MADIELERLAESVAKKQQLKESSLSRLMHHGQTGGYIIVSACRHELSEEENWKATKELQRLLDQSPFSYTHSTGGFPEEDAATGSTVDVREHSFVVFPRAKEGGVEIPFERLDAFGRMIAKKFGQQSILRRHPAENPKYELRDKSVDMEFDGPTHFNSDSPYFTALGRHTRNNVHRKDFKKRFSF